MSDLSPQEKVEMAEEAMTMVDEARNLISQLIHGLPEERYQEAYLLPQFDTLLGNGNPHDASIPKLIEELQKKWVVNYQVHSAGFDVWAEYSERYATEEAAWAQAEELLDTPNNGVIDVEVTEGVREDVS